MIDCRPHRSGWRRSGRSRVGPGRVARVLAAAGLGLLAAVLAAGPPAHAAGGPPAAGARAPEPPTPPLLAQDDRGVVDTEWGPLGPADRDLLVRVRYAGLWEIPAGRMAAERGVDPRVREIGADIATEHEELDRRVVEIAGKLGVSLPDQPLPKHQNYLNRMEDSFGDGFDGVFVQLLREQHGQVYPIIAYARSGTANELVRRFADTSEKFISRHMEYLETTGQVDWSQIKPPPEPLGAPSRFLGTQPAGIDPVFIWIILGAAAVAGAITVVRTVRPR